MAKLSAYHLAERDKKFLAGVSRLKEAHKIPNHPDKPDEIMRGGEAKLYTRDYESAQLLAQLIYNGFSHRNPRYYRHKPPTAREDIYAQEIEPGCFKVEFPTSPSWLLNFRDGLDKVTARRAASDKEGGRGR